MKCKLSEVMELIGGGTPKTTMPEYWNGNIPWLSVKDFNNDFRYVYSTEKTITELGLQNSSTKLLQKGDVIISARGTVGEIATIPYPMAFNQSCYGIRAKKDIVTSDFLYYLIKHNVSVLKKNTHGSVFDTITRDTFDNIDVNIPSIEQQERITGILSPIDEKIELNIRINCNLEQQARAIYQNMIIDNQSDEWEIGKLSDIAEITMGQSPKGDTYNENGIGTVFYQGRAEFGSRFPTRRLFTTEPKRMANEYDVLLSVRAPVGDLNIATEPCCIGRGLGAIHSIDNHQSFVLYTMLAVRKQLDIFNGEGTVFGSINKEALNAISVIIPDKPTLDRFETIVAPIDSAIRTNYEEICRLQNIRDTLLPKLMNGEIDVSEVEI